MADVTELRARAAQHERELQKDVRFLTVNDLAVRWRCSRSTVRAVPIESLPYLNLGQGLTRVARRYRVADVEAYEIARWQVAAGAPTSTEHAS